MPKAFKHVDGRSVVRINTGIRVADDPAGIRAHETVQALNSLLEAYWRGLEVGEPMAPVTSSSAREYLDQFRAHYCPVVALTANPIDDIARRVAAIMQDGRSGTTESARRHARWRNGQAEDRPFDPGRGV